MKHNRVVDEIAFRLNKMQLTEARIDRTLTSA